jgi:hypothetical protein
MNHMPLTLTLTYHHFYPVFSGKVYGYKSIEGGGGEDCHLLFSIQSAWDTILEGWEEG